jgi:UDPglucose 6-dehydrogenase
MRVGIIGMGHVGHNVAHRRRPSGVETVTYDIADELPYPEQALSTCAFVVVAVGTPAAPDGTADVSDVVEAVKRIPCERVLLRSTVPPGTTDELVAATGKSICFSPEYVGETTFASNSWETWAHDQSFQIIGGDPEARRWFLATLTSIEGASTRFFECTAVEAEIIKYMENCYLATKVTFVNEFYELCERVGANWFAVREGWLLDPRVERDHTAVLPDDRGYSGRCLPKDIEAFLNFGQSRGLPMPLIAAVRAANEHYKRGQ